MEFNLKISHLAGKIPLDNRLNVVFSHISLDKDVLLLGTPSYEDVGYTWDIKVSFRPRSKKPVEKANGFEMGSFRTSTTIWQNEMSFKFWRFCI